MRVELADGRALAARHVVLATGTPAARDVPLASGSWPRGTGVYLPDPWAVGALERLAAGKRGAAGRHRPDHGRCRAAPGRDSRPGVRLRRPLPDRAVARSAPLARGAGRARLPAAASGHDPAASRCARSGRRRSPPAARGGDERDVVDAMRPHTQAIWKGFSTPTSAASCAATRGSGRSTETGWHRRRDGWIASMRDAGPADDRGRVGGQRRAGGRPAQGGRAPAGRVGDRAARLRRRGQLRRPGRHARSRWARRSTTPAGRRPGPAASARARARHRRWRSGARTPRASSRRTVFTIGWMRRGELWESVAIPELRDQAAEIAGRVAAS